MIEGGQPPVTPGIFRDQASGDEAGDGVAISVATMAETWNVVTRFRDGCRMRIKS